MTTRFRRIACVAIVPALVVLAGCASTIDAGDLQDEIAKNAKQQAGDTVTVKCPDDITAEKGKKFTCAVTTKAGVRAVANITLQDSDGRYAWTIVAAVPGTAGTPTTTTPPPVAPPATTTPPATTPTTSPAAPPATTTAP